MKRTTTGLRAFGGARKGSVMVEAAASMFILAAVFIAVSYFSARALDMARNDRAVASVTALALQLDSETPSPSAGDIDKIVSAFAAVADLGPEEAYDLTVSVYGYDLITGVGLAWQGGHASGGGLVTSATAGFSNVTLNGQSHDIRDDERLVVVEYSRDENGMGGDGSSSVSVSYGYDPDNALSGG